MGIRLIVMSSVLLLCGCTAIQSVNEAEPHYDTDIPYADLDVVVEELPGAFQKAD